MRGRASVVTWSSFLHTTAVCTLECSSEAVKCSGIITAYNANALLGMICVCDFIMYIIIYSSIKWDYKEILEKFIDYQDDCKLQYNTLIKQPVMYMNY